MITGLILIFLIPIFTGNIYADTWENPRTKTYFSENGSFTLTIHPTEIPDNYYKWKRARQKKKKKYTEKDIKATLCHAILCEINGNDTIEIWNKRLINRIAPVTAILANDGKSIVTFDDWFSMGYGIDVMVVYDQNGGMVTRYQLEDISPIPINELPMTISSIRWRCGTKYLTNSTVEICIQNDKFEQIIRTYHVLTNSFEN